MKKKKNYMEKDEHVLEINSVMFKISLKYKPLQINLMLYFTLLVAFNFVL